MVKRLVVLFLACGLTAAFATTTQSQPSSLTLSADRTSIVVETTTPVEVLARFTAAAVGVGLKSGTLDSPVASGTSLAVKDSATQLSLAASYTPNQTQPQPSLSLDALWPNGTYQFNVVWTNRVGEESSNSVVLNSTLAWPATPVLQSPQPLLPIAGSSQDFTWQPWSNPPASGGTIAFTLYEGLLTLEMIEQIAAGDYSSLSSFTVVDTALALSATTSTRSVAGINPEMDHILLLEFASRATGTAYPVTTESRSSRTVTYFYRRELVTYPEWRAAQFPEADVANDAISGPEADPDLDGSPNLMEYAFAMSPLVSDQAGLPVAKLNEDTFVFDHYAVVGATDLTYAYEELGEDLVWRTLAPESYSVATTGAAPGRQTLRVTPVVAGSRKIIRVRASLTATP